MASRSLRKEEAQEGVSAVDVLPAEAVVLCGGKCGFVHKRSGQVCVYTDCAWDDWVPKLSDTQCILTSHQCASGSSPAYHMRDSKKSNLQKRINKSISCARMQGLVHNWKRRFCVLYSNLLYYYDSPTSSSPRGIVNLDGASISYGTHARTAAHVSVQIRTRTGRLFYLRDASEYEDRAWFEALRSVPNVIVEDERAAASAAPPAAVAASVATTSTAAESRTDTTMSTAQVDSVASESIDGGQLPHSSDESGVPDAEGRDAVATEHESSVPVFVLPAAPGMSLEPEGHAGPGDEAAWLNGGRRPSADITADFGVTPAVNSIIAGLPPDVQFAWVALLSAAQQGKEVEQENAALKAQLQVLVKARGDALQRAERDQATIAALTRQLEASQNVLALAASPGAPGEDRSATLISAISAEKQRAEERIREVEMMWSKRLADANANMEAEIDARVTEELRETMADYRDAERAGRRVVAELARESTVASAAVAARDAIATAVAAKEREVATLRAQLRAVADAAKAGGVALPDGVDTADLTDAAPSPAIRTPALGAMSSGDNIKVLELEDSVSELQSQLATAREAIAAANQRADDAERAAAVAKTALLASEARSLELRRKSEYSMRLTNEVKADGMDGVATMQASRDAAVAKAEELTIVLNRVTSEKEAAVAEAGRLRAQADALSAQVSALMSDLALLRSSNDELRRDIISTESGTPSQADARLTRLESVLANLKLENETLRGELDEFVTLNVQHKADVAMWRERNQELQTQLVGAEARYSALQAQLRGGRA